MKPFLAAMSLCLLSSPAWAIGCPVEPSPINCTGGSHFSIYSPVGSSYQVPTYRPVQPQEFYPQLPSYLPAPTTRCIARGNGYGGTVVSCQ